MDDGGGDILDCFEPDEMIAAMFAGKAFNEPFAVLVDAADKVICDADIDRPTPPVCHDVDRVGSRHETRQARSRRQSNVASLPPGHPGLEPGPISRSRGGREVVVTGNISAWIPAQGRDDIADRGETGATVALHSRFAPHHLRG